MSRIVPPFTQPALTLHKAADLVAERITWTVDQIIPAGMLTVLSGKDKVGKTLLAWEIARDVMRGVPFLGHFPVTSGPVIFLSLDDPAAVTMDRLETLTLRDVPDLYIARPLDCIPTHHGFWSEVEHQAHALSPRLVIVDALYLFLPHTAEGMNQAGAMGPVMLRFNKIAEKTGASVLLITHDTKQGGDVAGSFVIRAAAKQILRLTAPPNESSKRVLHIEGKITERSAWTLDFKGPGAWRLLDDDAEKLAQTRVAVSDWLRSGSRGTAEAIATAIRAPLIGRGRVGSRGVCQQWPWATCSGVPPEFQSRPYKPIGGTEMQKRCTCPDTFNEPINSIRCAHIWVP